MAVIRIVDPVGTMPAVQPRLLLDNQAQTAVNVKFGNREARPLGGATAEYTPHHGSDTLAIHRYREVGGTLGALTQTSDAVGSNIRHSALSPDGKWLAVALESTPFIAIYAVADAAITLPTSPTGGDIPAGEGWQVVWSPDGDYVFLGHSTSPYLSAWPWTGDWGTIITPASNPGSTVYGIAISPSGGYVAVAHETSPYLSLYPWTGAFGTRVQPTGDDIQAGQGFKVAFSRDSQWVLAAQLDTPFLSAWHWDGSLGGIRNPASLATGAGMEVVVSPDNMFVVLTQGSSPYLRAWRFDTNRKQQPFCYLLDDPATLPAGQVYGSITFDARGGFVYYGLNDSPYLEGYAWNRGGWGRKLTPGTNPGGTINGMSFPSSNEYLYGSFASTVGVIAIDRTSINWLNWDRRVKCEPGPVSNDYRYRRYYSGDGPPKKTGNDIAVPGTGSPPKLPADWFHMGVKPPGLLEVDNDGDALGGTPAGLWCRGVAWSPNGKYLAVAHEDSPYITIWDFTDPENPVKFANPATLPTGNGYSIAWSPDGDYVGIGHQTSPYVSIYPFSESGFGTKVANPGDALTGTGSGIAWSPDGEYVGISHGISRYMSIYPWDGTFGTILTAPATPPPDTCYDIAWSPDSKLVGVAHDTTPFVSVYPFTGTIGVKIANPAALPAGLGNGIAWSPDGEYVGVAHDIKPFVSIYPFSGSAFGTKVADPSTLPPDTGYSIAWNPDGKYLGIGNASGLENIYIYSWEPKTIDKREETKRKVTEYVRVRRSDEEISASGGLGEGGAQEFKMEAREKEVTEVKTTTIQAGFNEKVDGPKGLGGVIFDVAWSPDGDYIGMGHSLSPNLSIYPWLHYLTKRYYAITHVTGWGEESAPSEPVEVEEGHFNLPHLTFPNDDLTRQNITHRRIYRVVAGETGAAFMFVREVPISDTEFTDYVGGDDLGGVLVTAGWAEPPDDLTGLVSVQGGFMAGFSGKQVCFSEPYAPYAWPGRYRRLLPHTPLAIGTVGNAVIVATDGQPAVFEGSHPDEMNFRTLDANQACVSAESLVKVPGGVIYASPDGLFYVTPSAQKESPSWMNLTGEEEGKITLLSKEDWEALQPGTMVGVVYDGRYYGFYDSDGAGTYKALVINPKALSRGLRTDQAAAGSLANVAFSDLDTDTLYLVINGVIKAWDAGGAPMLHMPLTEDLSLERGWGLPIFTRASPGAYIHHNDDLLKIADVNVPRFEENGDLMEGAVPNLYDFTEETDNAYHSKPDATVTPDFATDPYGTTLADRIVYDLVNGANVGRAFPISGATAGRLFTISLWILVVSGSMRFTVFEIGGAAATTRTDSPTLAAGTLTRLQWTHTIVENDRDTIYPQVRMQDAGGGDAYVFGWQFEEMPFATSYTPSDSGPATRAKDDTALSIEGNIPLQSEPQTWFIDVNLLGHITGTAQYAFKIAGEDKRILQPSSAGDVPTLFYGDGSVSGPQLTPGQTYRLGVRFDGIDATLWIDGIKVGTITAPDVSDPLGTSIELGQAGGGAAPLFGNLANVRFYDRARSDAEMAGTAEDSPLTSTWKSKVFPMTKPLNLGWLQVRASYPGAVTVKVYAGGVLRATKSVTSDIPVRLPGGFLADEWEFEITSTIAWKELVAASSMAELRLVP